MRPECVSLGIYYPSLHYCDSHSTPPSQQSLGITQLFHGKSPYTSVTNEH